MADNAMTIGNLEQMYMMGLRMRNCLLHQMIMFGCFDDEPFVRRRANFRDFFRIQEESEGPWDNGGEDQVTKTLKLVCKFANREGNILETIGLEANISSTESYPDGTMPNQTLPNQGNANKVLPGQTTVKMTIDMTSLVDEPKYIDKYNKARYVIRTTNCDIVLNAQSPIYRRNEATSPVQSASSMLNDVISIPDFDILFIYELVKFLTGDNVKIERYLRPSGVDCCTMGNKARNANDPLVFTEADLFLWAVLTCPLDQTGQAFDESRLKLIWSLARGLRQDNLSSIFFAELLWKQLLASLNNKIDTAFINMQPQTQDMLNLYDALLAVTMVAEEKGNLMLELGYKTNSTCLGYILFRPSQRWKEAPFRMKYEINKDHMDLNEADYNYMVLISQRIDAKMYQNISPDTSTCKIFLCILTFLPIFFDSFISIATEQNFEDFDANHGRRYQDNAIGKLERRLQRLVFFYSSPIVKFFIYFLSYSAFLVVYILFLTLYLEPVNRGNEVIIEYVVIAWLLAFIVDEFYQNLNSDLVPDIAAYLKSDWNKYDVFMYLVTTTAFLLRNYYAVDFTRTVMMFGLSIMLFVIRLLQFFYNSASLGKEILLIKSMAKSVKHFFWILLVFIFSLGVTSIIVLRKKRDWYDIFSQIVTLPYLSLYSNFDVMEPFRDRNNTDYSDEHREVMDIVFIVYVLITNIVLLNMILVTMNDAYAVAKASAIRIWVLNRIKFADEFHNKSWVPPPFVALRHVMYLFFRGTLSICCWYRRRFKSRVQRESFERLEPADPSIPRKKRLVANNYNTLATLRWFEKHIASKILKD